MLDDTPIYLREEEGDAFLAMVHRPSGPPSETAVVLVAPFGYDHLCAYRSMRAWARQLAAEGHVVLRFDPPATGDSAGGPREPDVARRWVRSVGTAARWLREPDVGASRVVAIGLGLGGLLAVQAAVEGAPVDDLVLWGAPGRGRQYLRELRAFSRLGTAVDDESYNYPPTMPPLPEGAQEAGGFLLSAETCAAIGAMDATATPLPGAAGRRALLLSREDITVDVRLERALREAGVDVQVAPGPGWAAMLDAPHLAAPPLEVFATTTAWLGEAPAVVSAIAGTPSPAVAVSDVLDLGTVIERPLSVDTPGGRVFAVLAEPAAGAPLAGVTAILLNVGAERRIGPNRLWTEVARRWAARGVPTLRVDLLGIGDADGLDALTGLPSGFLYDAQYLAQLTATLDAAAARGLPEHFVVSGVCSGAYWAFQLAVADRRVALALPINARLLLFDNDLAVEEAAMYQRVAQAPAAPAPLAAQTSRGTALGERVLDCVRHPRLAPVRRAARHPVAHAVVRRAWGLTTRGDELDRTLDLLRDRGQTVTLRFTPGEALYLELERENRLARARRRWPNLTAEVIDGPPDTHTLQVVRMQRHVHDLLDASLDAELARVQRRAV
jgi:dienelactone hydrolase